LNGEIIRVANLMGKQAPINETLLRIAQEMASNKEQPGKYTPEQLVEILRLQ
jgi:ketopantoate reductase